MHAKADFINLSNKALAYLKCRIHTESITYAIRKKREESRHLVYLNESLAVLEANLSSSPSSSDLSHITKVKDKIEEIYNQKATGCIIRSRCNLIDEYGKPIKFFLSLEKAA